MSDEYTEYGEIHDEREELYATIEQLNKTIILLQQDNRTLAQELDAAIAHIQRLLKTPDEPTIECWCCGGIAAEGMVTDGDPLMCGCSGHIGVCVEEGVSVILGDEECERCAAEERREAMRDE